MNFKECVCEAREALRTARKNLDEGRDVSRELSLIDVLLADAEECHRAYTGDLIELIKAQE